jgi:hypothetical protein
MLIAARPNHKRLARPGCGVHVVTDTDITGSPTALRRIVGISA